MNTSLTSILVVFVTFTVLATAQQCQDRMATKTCQYFVKMYREKKIETCKWKQMTTNCALTCKVCVPLPKCARVASRYGCCWDNKTEAKSHAGESCPECEDRYPSYCRQRISQLTKEKACNERGTNMCPKSCGACRVKALASALPDCLNSPYGCCWDLTAALGPRGEGCTVCRDNYHRLCSLFSGYCKEEVYKSVKKHIVDRYRKNCPKTCGKCAPGQKKLDISVYRRH